MSLFRGSGRFIVRLRLWHESMLRINGHTMVCTLPEAVRGAAGNRAWAYRRQSRCFDVRLDTSAAPTRRLAVADRLASATCPAQIRAQGARTAGAARPPDRAITHVSREWRAAVPRSAAHRRAATAAAARYLRAAHAAPGSSAMATFPAGPGSGRYCRFCARSRGPVEPGDAPCA